MTTQTAVQDNGGIGLCSRLDPALLATVQHLAPGTYFVNVLPFSASATFAYDLQATVVALCGNGIKEGSEACDGGPTCAADCTLLPVCGNFLKQAGEQCDDGNAVSGDGCSATCQWETTAEVEPNDTAANADTNATTVPALLITGTPGTVNYTGTYSAAADKDIVKLVVATQSTIRAEIFDASGADCIVMPVSTMKLFDSAFVQLKTDLSGTVASGISGCAALVFSVAPGTYYLQTTGAAVGVYFMQVKFESDKGSELEPNDTLINANAFGGTDSFIAGVRPAGGTDIDWYAITLPTSGLSVRAETIEGGATTCESNGVDTKLALFNAAGTSLVTDDDDGRGFCSAIDGTGATPRDAAAHNLPAGTYYLQVGGYSAISVYRLVMTIR